MFKLPEELTSLDRSGLKSVLTALRDEFRTEITRERGEDEDALPCERPCIGRPLAQVSDGHVSEDDGGACSRPFPAEAVADESRAVRGAEPQLVGFGARVRGRATSDGREHEADGGRSG